jgi:hypothetical protein
VAVRTEAFRWTRARGMLGLGVLEGFFESSALGVSADGSVVVGESSGPQSGPVHPRRAFRWTAAEGMQGLDALVPGGRSFARAISPDGRVIVGWSDNPYPRTEAVLWTESGEIVRLDGLGNPPGVCCLGSRALAASFDGSVVVGTSDGPLQAFVWDAHRGMRSLKEILEAEGLDLAGWTLFAANAISHDGRSIAGTGFNPDGDQEAWLAVLPVDDADDDGVADAEDECPETPAGEAVDPALGCSVGQLCPCRGPRERDVRWRSHGQFVACVARVAAKFSRRGLIEREEKRSLVREAAHSRCGKRSHGRS